MDTASLTLLQDRDNTTYGVDVEGERRYVLRVCRAEPLRMQRATLELAWLRALGRDTDLQVPEPHAIYVDDGDERRVCVAFRWREGASLHPARLTPPMAREIGRIAAVLHRHAHAWSPRRSAALPPEISFRRRRGRARLTARENAIVDAVAALIRSTNTTLHRRASPWGLIHADMTPENCVALDDRLTLIDYADVTHGFFLHDIAVFFASIRFHHDYDALTAAYFEGYSMVLPPPSRAVRSLERLIAGRLVSQALWLAGHAAEPQFGEHELARAQLQIAEVETFLNKGTFAR